MISPLDKIDAINEMLSALGVSPIDSIENSNDIDVMNALRILKSSDRDIQSKGWTFNTFEDYALVPDDETKQIKWDSKWLAIDNLSLIKRGGFIYDKDSKTDKFDSKVVATIIYHTEFEELPTVFRRYITAIASREFVNRYLGDPSVSQALAIEEQQAYMGVMEYEMAMEKNSLRDNSHIQSIIRR